MLAREAAGIAELLHVNGRPWPKRGMLSLISEVLLTPKASMC